VRDDEPAELNFNLQSLAGIVTGMLEPTTRELEPRHERRARATRNWDLTDEVWLNPERTRPAELKQCA